MLFRAILFLSCFLIEAVASAGAEEIAWPVEPCAASEIASASPAPLLSDSTSLARVPFILGAQTSAAYVVSLDETGHPIIRCVLGNSDPALVYPGMEVVAGLVFAAPARPNTVINGGRYLVRLYDALGVGSVRPPPVAPILPGCGPFPAGGEPAAAPKPAHRVQPEYPAGALDEGIEGEAMIVVDVYPSGSATPRCIGGSTPPGWFEQAAIEAVGQWRFEALDAPGGPRFYSIAVRFRLD